MDGADQAGGGALERILDAARKASGVPGAAVGLSREGQRLTAASGLADATRKIELSKTSRFGVGCVSKLLTGIACAELVAEGRLDLETPVAAILPELARSDRDGLTLAQLMRHTGGYQGPLIFQLPLAKFSWDGFVAHMQTALQVSAPGTVFNYENTGHAIVGRAVEILTGAPILDHVRRYVLEPLDIEGGAPMADYKHPTRYVAPHRPGPDGAAAQATFPSKTGDFWQASLADLTLSVEDLLTIGEALVGLKGEDVFAPARRLSAEGRLSLPHCVSGRRREHSPTAFNTLCAEYEPGWFGYAGSAPGQTLAMRFNPAARAVSVAALNMWAPIYRDALMDRLCGTTTNARDFGPGGVTGIDLAQVAGRYIGGGNILREVEVSTDGASVTLAITGDGLTAEPFTLGIDADGRLVPDHDRQNPPVGFFTEPGPERPCLMIGLAAFVRP